MNHRPFEDWLLSGEPLSSAQSSDLRGHLASCEYCSALTEVNTALHGVQLASPSPGFATRFEARLQAQRALQRRRTLWGLLFLGLGAAVVILIAALRFVLPVAGLRLELLPAYFASLVSLYLAVRAMGETLSVFLRIAAGFVPGYLWVLAAMLLGLLSWLWVVSISRFAPNPIPDHRGPQDL